MWTASRRTLAEIRTDAVVAEFHRRLPWAGFTFCQTAINALADMYTPRSQATLRFWREWFQQSCNTIQREEEEADEDLDSWEPLATMDDQVEAILAGMVRQLMADGVTLAKEFIELGKAGSELCEATLAACTMWNLDFPAGELAEAIIVAEAAEYPLDDDDENGEDGWDEEDWDEEDWDDGEIFGESDDLRGSRMTGGVRPPVNLRDSDEGSPINQPFKKAAPRVGRNAPCPCGSGKKFKNCCMRK